MLLMLFQITQRTDSESSQEVFTSEDVASNGHAGKTAGDSDEGISVDEATDQLAIPTETGRKTGNQQTDTYYFYQGTYTTFHL